MPLSSLFRHFHWPPRFDAAMMPLYAMPCHVIRHYAMMPFTPLHAAAITQPHGCFTPRLMLPHIRRCRRMPADTILLSPRSLRDAYAFAVIFRHFPAVFHCCCLFSPLAHYVYIFHTVFRHAAAASCHGEMPLPFLMFSMLPHAYADAFYARMMLDAQRRFDIAILLRFRLRRDAI